MSRVIIVGAGLGGLTAAYLLDQAGHDVTVLEARLRPGGRVRTLREPFADGLYAEAGGAFVSPGHANVTRWCEHFGLDLDPFPPAKARAIRDLRYSSTTRTYVQTRTRFWSEPWSFFTTDEPVSMVRHVTFNQPGPRGIVESYVSGPRGRLAATATEPERVGSTVRGLERIFPGFATQAEGGASYSWFTAPWARGSEAWYAPGEEVANFPHHPTTEGRIHFAGEHTELAAGMNGAIGSGQRVAREIEGLLVKRGGPDQ